MAYKSKLRLENALPVTRNPGLPTSGMPSHVFILIGTNKVGLTFNITDHVIMNPVSIKFRIHVFNEA